MWLRSELRNRDNAWRCDNVGFIHKAEKENWPSEHETFSQASFISIAPQKERIVKMCHETCVAQLSRARVTFDIQKAPENSLELNRRSEIFSLAVVSSTMLCAHEYFTSPSRETHNRNLLHASQDEGLSLKFQPSVDQNVNDLSAKRRKRRINWVKAAVASRCCYAMFACSSVSVVLRKKRHFDPNFYNLTRHYFVDPFMI